MQKLFPSTSTIPAHEQDTPRFNSNGYSEVPRESSGAEVSVRDVLGWRVSPAYMLPGLQIRVLRPQLRRAHYKS